MRTTLDLPDDLLKQAKITAVHRGSSLRDLVASALRRELSAAPERALKPPQLPVVKLAADAPVLKMSMAQLKRLSTRLELEDDLRRSR